MVSNAYMLFESGFVSPQSTPPFLGALGASHVEGGVRVTSIGVAVFSGVVVVVVTVVVVVIGPEFEK